MRTSPEQVDKLLSAMRPIYTIINCMIENEHPGDDALALHALDAIKRLATALYPFPDGSDVSMARALALGYIAGTALRAIEGEPPEIAP